MMSCLLTLGFTLTMHALGPALFFFVNGQFLIHGCPLSDGENYGNFINYPHSHMNIWNKYYLKKYGVDFDYYPRGRVVYRKTDDTYLIYYDKCIENEIVQLSSQFEKCEKGLDEHYQCHKCNSEYVI